MKHITYNILRVVSVFLLCVTCYMLHVTFAAAQNVTLSLMPPKTELLVKPGKSLLIGYTIQNAGDPTPLQVRVRSISPKGEYGEITVDDELTSPIRFSLDNTDMQFETPFFMKQRDITQALLRIAIPEGTPEGDYYFIFLTDTQPAPSQAGSTNTLAQATIGSPLLLTVTQSGTTEVKTKIVLFSLKPDMKISLFGKTYQLVESSSKVPLVLIVQNQGKNLVSPSGEIRVKSQFGEQKTYSLPEQNILANSSRLLRLQDNQTDMYTSGFISGNFIGSQTVTASLIPAPQIPPLTATIVFVGIPLRYLLILTGVIFLSVIIIVWFQKKKSTID